MDSERTLGDALTSIAEERLPEALALVAVDEHEQDVGRLALASFVAFMASEQDAALALARRACAGASASPEDRVLALAARAMALGSRELPELTSDPFTDLLATLPHVPCHTRLGSFIHYLSAEAALAHARLDVARELIGSGTEVIEPWRDHAYFDVMRVCAARAAAFAGRISEALEVLPDRPPTDIIGWLSAATRALVTGNAADQASVDDLTAAVTASGIEPSSRMSRGVYLLMAFGAVAVGEVQEASLFALRAGGGADMTELTTTDRVYAWDLLVTAAVEVGDLVAAETWCDRACYLSEHRIAAPAVARMQARLALLNNDPLTAEQFAIRASGLATADGRAVEVAEAEMLLARARIASGNLPEATRSLRAVVRDGDEHGHLAVRRSAASTLGKARRRLPPRVGSGWDGLSDRESEIANLILAGHDQLTITKELFLSPATVRVHTSRVLAAFGVASRIGLIAKVGAAPGATPTLPAITSRQREVLQLVAAACTNAQIAAELGISVKGVEKHVADLMRLWAAPSRFDLALWWWRSRSEPAFS